MPNKPFGTGAVIRPADNRDYKLTYALGGTPPPAVFKPDYSTLPVKMQGQYGTCGGHAGGALESFLEMLDLSPKYVWKQVKAVYDAETGTPLSSDTGVDMRSIFKALQQYGACHESLCPDVLDPTFVEYSNSSTITVAQANDAEPNGVTANYAFIDNPTWPQIQQAIYEFKAVICQVRCGDGWWTAANGTASYAKADILPLRLGNYVDGHFIVLWGYDENYIYFRNSWGTSWASTTGEGTDGGNGYFDISYLPNVVEIGTAIPGVSVQQQLVSLYTTLINVLQQIVSSLKGRTS